MLEKLLDFNSPKKSSSGIKVVGVGGSGCNAVSYMYNLGIEDVDFIICSTDRVELERSNVPNKIQLGVKLTQGLGTGSDPLLGRKSAIENIEDIKEILKDNTIMVFITAGMGGGTGTGGAPVIAEVCKEMGKLTVAVVSLPFSFEGKEFKENAEKGIKELNKHVDTILVICNQKLIEMYGDLRFTEAYAKADDVLTIAVKGMAEIITKRGRKNVDFRDAEKIMKGGGAAIMGYGIANGENRAIKSIESALSCPLLNDNSIKGAKYILLNITTPSGKYEITTNEIYEINSYLEREAGAPDNFKHGIVIDDSLGDNISVTVIVTHIKQSQLFYDTPEKELKLKVHDLNDRSDKNIKKTFVFEKIESDTEGEEEITNQNIPTLVSGQKNKEESKKTLKELSKQSINNKFNTVENLEELERRPAYERQNAQLFEIPHSSDSDVSRFYLHKGDKQKPKLNDDNPHLNDNVD